MFKSRVIAAVLGAVSIAVPAFANTVIVTSPTGVFTNPGSTNATGPGAAYNTWFANNVRNSGSVGITNTYADSGNGSIQFSGPTNSKADFEYDFTPGTGFALTSLTALSYDVYRSSTSTVNADLEPAFRLTVADANGNFLGSLVYEGAYNNQAPPVGSFATENILNDYFWASGSLLPNNSNSANPVFNRTLADWSALIPGLQVTGFTTGIGSGWTGSFDGAVDNISYAINGGTATDFNFETAATSPVPEPSSITLLGVGMLAVGTMWMRRRNEATIL